MFEYHRQSQYDVRFDWGVNGLSVLEDSEAIVIVDVLSFSTCVDLVTAQGGEVHPFPYKDDRAAEFARNNGLIHASLHRSKEIPSLAASSLVNVGSIKIVLPSPNGSTLSSIVRDTPCFAACLRNAQAIARAVSKYKRVAITAAGERWPDGSIRFAIEDLIGAGAIINELHGGKSPEAMIAETAYLSARSDLAGVMQECASGRELIERGFPEDVLLASDLNASTAVPCLIDGRYVDLLHFADKSSSVTKPN